MKSLLDHLEAKRILFSINIKYLRDPFKKVLGLSDPNTMEFRSYLYEELELTKSIYP